MGQVSSFSSRVCVRAHWVSSMSVLTRIKSSRFLSHQQRASCECTIPRAVKRRSDDGRSEVRPKLDRERRAAEGRVNTLACKVALNAKGAADVHRCFRVCLHDQPLGTAWVRWPPVFDLTNARLLHVLGLPEDAHDLWVRPYQHANTHTCAINVQHSVSSPRQVKPSTKAAGLIRSCTV